jgi:hypothetical protein
MLSRAAVCTPRALASGTAVKGLEQPSERSDMRAKPRKTMTSAAVVRDV